jgi:hypothetical protein
MISDKMSQWVTPTKYFVSFPYGIYHPGKVRDHRDAIRGPESFFLEYEGKTVRDNMFLAFTFFPEDWPKFKWNIKNQCTGGNKNKPFEERWSSRHFTLDKIFNLDIIDIDKSVEIEKYYSLDSWDSLKEYYKSDLKIPRPTKQFMKPYIFNKETESDL